MTSQSRSHSRPQSQSPPRQQQQGQEDEEKRKEDKEGAVHEQSTPRDLLSELRMLEHTARKSISTMFFRSVFAASNDADGLLAILLEEAAVRSALRDEGESRRDVTWVCYREAMRRMPIAAEQSDELERLFDHSGSMLQECIHRAAMAQLSSRTTRNSDINSNQRMPTTMQHGNAQTANDDDDDERRTTVAKSAWLLKGGGRPARG